MKAGMTDMTDIARWSPLRSQGWLRLAPRERRLVALAAALVALAVVWWLAVAPAWQTLRAAPARHAALDQQLDRMRELAREAQTLQGQPRLARDAALRALEDAVRGQLGAQGQMAVVGDRATVTLRGVAPAVLAAWLAQVRSTARALPVEARLTRGPQGWDGAVVLGLAPAP